MSLGAVAILTGLVTGTINFGQQSPDGPVTVLGEVRGLTPGEHGFHVHQSGDMTNGCTSMGSHYNPFSRNHGGPNDKDRHVGDLGNIVANVDGIATVDITDNQISLSGKYSILGRGLVVHADADDFGKGGYYDSLSTGHAGARVGCGIILESTVNTQDKRWDALIKQVGDKTQDQQEKEPLDTLEWASIL